MGGRKEAGGRGRSLMEGVARATVCLLHGADHEAAVREALPVLARATGADRVYIYEHVDRSQGGTPAVRLRFSWPAGRAPEAAVEIPYPELGFASWYDTLSGGRSVQCSRNSLSGAARDFLVAQGTWSALIVPICIEGRLWGVVGFDDCRRERRWSAEEEAVLTTAAAAIGAALRRARDEALLRREMDALRRREEQMAALLDVSRAIAGTLDLEEILDRVQRRARSSLECDAVMTFYWDRERRRYRMIAQHGLSAALVERVGELEVGPDEGVAGLLRERSTVQLAEGDPSFVDLQREFRISHLLATQLRVRGRPLGGLVAVRVLGAPPFEESHAALLEGIGAQLAVALETADLYRNQREDAAVFRALVDVGRELIASLSEPDVLERLCRVTRDALACDFAHTWLHDQQSGEFRLAAGAGDAPETFEAMRAVRVPETLVAGLVRRLATDDVVQIVMDEPQDLVPVELPRRFEITAALYLGLRRPDGLRGILTAGYCRHDLRFDARQERIARGIQQLASLALENSALLDALARANRLKSEFVATISHELRTPLNVIMGYTDLLREGVFGDVTREQEETLDRIERSARELLDLINATLDLSRLDAGRLPVIVEPVRLDDLLAALEAETAEVRAKPGVAYRREVPAELPELATDATKLKVILKNLIQNAFKFTDRGSVVLRVVASDQGVEFAVEDTGIGIDPGAREVIFEAFRQGDGSLARRHGGAGLGLYIVRRLAGLLGGQVSVDSEVGRGSTFRLWLPLRLPGMPPTGA